MSTSLLFNLSFDLGAISLILFVVWFFVNFNNSAAAFKWFSLSILALLSSVIILSYGSTKLAKSRSSLPIQNQTEITNLKQEISTLKSKKSDKSKSNDKTKKHLSKKSVEFPSRIVNQTDNQIVKDKVTKHEHHINLVAKVDSASYPIIVRGVHSNQHYKINENNSHPVRVGEFVIVKGLATTVNNDTINVKATTVEHQPNS